MYLINRYKSKLASDSLWVMLGFGINALSALVTSMLLTRILDIKSVGVYFLAFSCTMVLSRLAQYGLNVSVVKYIGGAQKDDEHKSLRNLILKMLSIVILGASIFALLFVSGITKSAFDNLVKEKLFTEYLTLIGFWIFFIAIRSFLAEVFRGFHDIKHAALFQRILPNILLVMILLSIYYLKLSVDLYSIILIPIFIDVLIILLIVPPFLSRIKSLNGKQHTPIRSVLQSSTPLAIGQLLQFVISQTPLWVLGTVSAADSIANYGVAYRFAAIVSLPLLVANNVIMPLVAKYHSTNNRSELDNMIHVAVTLTSASSILLLMIYVFFGEWLLKVFFGVEYSDAYSLLVIIGCGYAVNVLSGSPSIILAMSSKEKYIFFSSLSAALMTLAFSYISIPVYGVHGAALSTAFGVITLNMMLLYYCRKVLGYKPNLSFVSIKTTMGRIIS